MTTYTLLILDKTKRDERGLPADEEIEIQADDSWSVFHEAARIAKERHCEVVVYQGEEYLGVV